MGAFRLGLGLLVASGTAWAAEAATFNGKVSDPDGKGVPGAIVSVVDDKKGLTESVYSDANGNFRLDTKLSGALSLKIRKTYYADLLRPLELSDKGATSGSFALEPLKDAGDISDGLPAAYHFGQIAFKPGTPFAKDRFQRDCLTCHQLGNEFTRWKRTPEEWDSTIERMHGYLGNFDGELRKERSVMLSKAFDGTPLTVRPVFPFDPQIARAKIVEYRLDKSLIPHDAEVSTDDGLVYTADQQAEVMAITNLEKGTTEYVPAPHDGMQIGGKFAKLGLKPLLEVYRGPHSLALGHDGKWYTTDTIATQIGVFNPKTKQWEKSHDIPGETLYPHTIRVAGDGLVWFTIIATNQVGRLDPATGKVTVIPLPQAPTTSLSSSNAPYGIDVNPKDGSIWYAKLFADRIGRVDAKTLAVTEYDSPIKGPRRMRFDKSGHLWVAGYSEGVIARIDPARFKSELYPMPEFAPGYRPAPYALGINPKTQEIWVNETMTDHIYRLIPKEKRWVAYPMPLRGTYTREMSFTKSGDVCTTNNPIPIQALEGGVGELICIHPDDHKSPSTKVAAQ